jgi:hypothetical protein
LAYRMSRTPDNPYPDDEFPWSFYFNGVLMPKWGACWGLAQVCRFLKPAESWDNDVGPRDVCLIAFRIDHVGAIESAEPDVFIYTVQEVLCILLGQKEAMLESLRTGSVSSKADEVYNGLVSAALQVRRLASEQQVAFWTSGYEQDRLRLLSAIEHARLPPSDPRYKAPPHRRRLVDELARCKERQRSRLHSLAQSGQLEKELRRELHAI